MRRPVLKTGIASCASPPFLSTRTPSSRYPTTDRHTPKLNSKKRWRKSIVDRICTKFFPSCPSIVRTLNTRLRYKAAQSILAQITRKIQINLSRTPQNYYNKPPAQLNFKVFPKRWPCLQKQRPKTPACSQAHSRALLGSANRSKSQRKFKFSYRDRNQIWVQTWSLKLLNKI
jgi:hypothetical protein